MLLHMYRLLAKEEKKWKIDPKSVYNSDWPSITQTFETLETTV